MSPKFKTDLRISLKVVWIIISAFMTFIMFMSVFYPEALISAAPVCYSKMFYNTECFMCGMTRAFTDISAGNFFKALELNEMSIALYLIFTINTIAFFYLVFIKIKRMFFKFKKPLITLLNKN